MPDIRYIIVYLILINLFSFIYLWTSKNQKGQMENQRKYLHAAGSWAE